MFTPEARGYRFMGTVTTGALIAGLAGWTELGSPGGFAPGPARTEIEALATLAAARVDTLHAGRRNAPIHESGSEDRQGVGRLAEPSTPGPPLAGSGPVSHGMMLELPQSWWGCSRRPRKSGVDSQSDE